MIKILISLIMLVSCCSIVPARWSFKMGTLLLLFLLTCGIILAQELTSITVISPNGGEEVISEQSFTITWSTSNITGDVVIELLQNDIPVGIIASKIPAENCQYIWTGGRLADNTQVSGTDFKVRVRTANTIPEQITSLEFGHSGYPVKDYCNPLSFPEDFGNGALFSVWTRIPVPLVAPPGFPSTRGNMNVFYFYGSNWGLTCLVGNAGVNSSGLAIYNANFMLDPGDGTWGGDYCTYQTFEADMMPVADVNGWVWVAWQVVINADHSMTLRQWLKFGMNGIVFPAGNFRIVNGNWEELIPHGEEIVSMEGWLPSNPKSFRIGDDNTYSGVNTVPNSYLCHARMEARTSKPTVEELEVISRLNAPDPTAWGDWELNWKNNAPNLLDRSGHGRNLSIQLGGALYQGVLGPDF